MIMREKRQSDIVPEIFPHHFEAVSVDRSNRCRQLCQQEYFVRRWTSELWPSWKDDGQVETRGRTAVGTRPRLINRNIISLTETETLTLFSVAV